MSGCTLTCETGVSGESAGGGDPAMTLGSMHSCIVTMGKRTPSFSYVFRISGPISSRVETVSSVSK
ncbi:hypothetical protein ACVWXO_001347 [Bradyrhizobium sp. LM2.7]